MNTPANDRLLEGLRRLRANEALKDLGRQALAAASPRLLSKLPMNSIAGRAFLAAYPRLRGTPLGGLALQALMFAYPPLRGHRVATALALRALMIAYPQLRKEPEYRKLASRALLATRRRLEAARAARAARAAQDTEVPPL